MNDSARFPDEYEEIITEYGAYMSRKNIVNREEHQASMLRKMRMLHNPIRLFFTRLFAWTEHFDGWLHKRGLYVAPVCCAADFCYGVPFWLAFHRWITRPWRIAGYTRRMKREELPAYTGWRSDDGNSAPMR